MTNNRTHLLIIDPQNDFCDLPEGYCPTQPGTFGPYSPSLPVAGAHADMQRIAALIDQCGDTLIEITVTLDSHQRIDIAHPGFWQRGDGSEVSPFTQIRAIDVQQKLYLPRYPAALPRVVAYLEALEANARYVHMVWPVHCEIGTWGHNVHDDVRRAYNRWEEAHVSVVNKVVKGTNPWTEHFSAIKAEVPDLEDETTQLNTSLLARLQQADRILICGEAGSHCVKATTEHIVENLAAEDVGRLTLLTDCMSPVAGFEKQHDDFIEDMRGRGVRIAKSTDVIPELLAGASR